MARNVPHEHIEIVDEGQFEDAPEDEDAQYQQASSATNPREGHRYIDEEEILQWSSDESEEPEYDAFDSEEDNLEASAFQTLRPEDEDWEVAEGGWFIPLA